MSTRAEVSRAGQKIAQEKLNLEVFYNPSDRIEHEDFGKAIDDFNAAAKAFRESIGKKDMVEKAGAYKDAAKNFRTELEKIRQISAPYQVNLNEESLRGFIAVVRAFEG